MRHYVHRWIHLFSFVEMRLCACTKTPHCGKEKRGCLWIAARSFTCRLFFFTSHHLSCTSEVLPSMIGLSAFLPGHYDLIRKLGRNQVCNSSPNQSAIPSQFFGFTFIWMYPCYLFLFFPLSFMFFPGIASTNTECSVSTPAFLHPVRYSASSLSIQTT